MFGRKPAQPKLTPMQQQRKIRKFEQKEHKYLAKRSILEWNHMYCPRCSNKRPYKATPTMLATIIV